jgi:hypothetical protein
MAPFKRQKVKAVTVDLGSIPACGLTARGLKLTTKAVTSVQLLPEKEKPGRGGGLLDKASHLAQTKQEPKKKGKK